MKYDPKKIAKLLFFAQTAYDLPQNDEPEVEGVEEVEEGIDCENCGNTVDDLTKVKIDSRGYDTEMWCDSCINDDTFSCDRCHEAYSDAKNDAVAICRDRRFGETDNWCEACADNYATKCSSCDRYFTGNRISIYRLSDGDSICEHCYTDGDYFTCENCDEIFSTEEMSAYDGNGLYCRECDPKNLDFLLKSDANPLDRQHGLIYDEEILKGTKKPYMGVELEVESDPDGLAAIANDAIHNIQNRGKWGLIKKDASLEDNYGNINGFEITTVPMLLDKHKESWENNFFNEDFINSLEEEGSNTGMHIHLNKQSMSYIGLARLIFLVYGQAENIHFIRMLAERSPSAYWHQDPKDIKETIKSKNNDEKYEALNLRKPNTIEFRMFLGKVNKLSIYKNMEFVAASQQFCNNELFIRPTWQNFMGWVYKNETSYPNLIEFINTQKQNQDIASMPYFDDGNSEKFLDKFQTQSDYFTSIFKMANNITIYFQNSNNGATVFCTEDGANWWLITTDHRYVPLCGTVPSAEVLQNAKTLPIQALKNSSQEL